MERFALARMSFGVAVGTWLLLAMGPAAPVAILIMAPAQSRWLAPVAAVFLWSIFALVYGLWRPREFVVTAEGLQIVWPWRVRTLLREEIVAVRPLTRDDLGRTLRVFGAGGLWGAFGRFHSRNLGPMEMYISRRDGMILIERLTGPGLVITPERTTEFVGMMKV
ncbi:MAG: PH domain-containing protein [Planctomycetaceae bacterium]|nr:PH domain-containing protein [Planctomycetaceae bacterium]